MMESDEDCASDGGSYHYDSDDNDYDSDVEMTKSGDGATPDVKDAVVDKNRSDGVVSAAVSSVAILEVSASAAQQCAPTSGSTDGSCGLPLSSATSPPKATDTRKRDASIAATVRSVSLTGQHREKRSQSKTPTATRGGVDDGNVFDTELSDDYSLPSSPKIQRKQASDFRSLSFPRDVGREIDRLVAQVSELTALESPEAKILLREFKWDPEQLTEAWFSDPERLCKKVGLTIAPENGGPGGSSCSSSSSSSSSSTNASGPITCNVCFETLRSQRILTLADLPDLLSNTPRPKDSSYLHGGRSRGLPASFGVIDLDPAPDDSSRLLPLDDDDATTTSLLDNPPGRTASVAPGRLEPLDDDDPQAFALPCGHVFCTLCWKGHFQTGVGDGATCLTLRCMADKCPERVRWSMFPVLAADCEAKALEYERKSYVELSQRCKWCPSPDCNNCVIVNDVCRTIESVRDPWIRTAKRPAADTSPPAGEADDGRKAGAGKGDKGEGKGRGDAKRAKHGRAEARMVEAAQDRAEILALRHDQLLTRMGELRAQREALVEAGKDALKGKGKDGKAKEGKGKGGRGANFMGALFDTVRGFMYQDTPTEKEEKHDFLQTLPADSGNADIQPLQCREVECSRCEYKWCFACNSEGHKGIYCHVVRKWSEKNQDEAENVTWIIANTKSCPKCKNPIEKNQGCMHIVCRCGHQFCWLCLADDYNYSHTRDGRPCNKFMQPDEEKEHSRKNLARYAHFFERFRAHEQSQSIAQQKTLKQVRGKMEDLQKLFGNWEDVLFLEEAIKQLIDCRRMLKWTYAFSYFLGKSSELFEFQQGQLEQKVDSLQALFENSPFIKRDLLAEADNPEQQGSGASSSSSTSTGRASSSSSSAARAHGAASSSITATASSTSNNTFSLVPTFGAASASSGTPASAGATREEFMAFKQELTNLTKVVSNFFLNITDFFDTIRPEQLLLLNGSSS
ncbi:unnamed protein product [Amoebophrya sp. A25]|nr:unnamed protein product [Amoebophrya sp. A25]|eukprot:GSA25T00002359001.1